MLFIFQINAVLLNFLFIKKKITVSIKILNSPTIFKIVDHVTLKSGVMMLKIQLCQMNKF